MKRVQKDRDEIAFSEIFDFFAPKINAYFIQNRIKIESSEELTQEVFRIFSTLLQQKLVQKYEVV